MNTSLAAHLQPLATHVEQARQQQQRIAGRHSADLTLAEAYQIQRHRFGEQLCAGYKLGLISPAKQQQMGIATPIYGRISPAMLHDSQHPIALGQFIQPRVEPEIALQLAADIPAGAAPGVVQHAIGGFFIGVDLLDSVWDGYQFTLAEVVADNTSGGGFVAGAVGLPAMPTGVLRLYHNGTLRSEGHTAILGDPVAQLTWLAGEVGGLQRGQIIFLGSPAPAQPATAGTLELVLSDGQLLFMRLEE